MPPQDSRAKGNMNEPDKSENEGNPPSDGDKVTYVKPDLFNGVKFCICDDVDAAEEVKKVLVERGGKLVNYLSDIATHLIASNPDHQDVCQAVEIYEKPVVTSRWVWMSAKAGRLLPTIAFSPLKNRLMSGVVACPSNLQSEDLDAIWAMVIYNGGSFQIHLDKLCSHLITTKAEGAKYEKALSMGDGVKIVTPDWVIDSIKGKKLCDEELYHPRLLISPFEKPEMNTDTFITPVTMQESVNITTSTLIEQNNAVTTSSPTTQVSLKTVTLPPTTMITSVSAPGPVQPARPLRVFVPSQNHEVTSVAPQQSSQPRQVYLALQQPQIRQQQVNFAQVRQHTPRGQGSEGVQMPVKPIILQQRIQPPALQQVQPQQQTQQQTQQLVHQVQPSQQHIHQQQTQVQQPPQLQHLQHHQQHQLQLQQSQQQHHQQQQQYPQHIPQHYPQIKDGQTGIVHSSFVQNHQQTHQTHPQQQQIQQTHQQQVQPQSQPQLQQQQLQHPPHPQTQDQILQQQPLQQQQPQMHQQQQQQQFTQIQQQPHLKQQYIQNQQYHLQNQQPIQNQAQQQQQQPNQIAFKMGAQPNYPGSAGMLSPNVQYVNTLNQNQTVQDPNQQIRFVPGQMIQVQRQVAPMQQRPTHMQQIQSGQQMMRPPIPQTQVFASTPSNQDNLLQEVQHPNSVRMVQNQQFIPIQRHNTPNQIANVNQHNGPHLIRTSSPQQAIYQNQVPHPRPMMQGVQQVMQSGAPIYNQQGQQVAVGPSQVQRVPQLRMQPNYQQMPRNQFRGPVQAQQIVASGPPRTFIRQGAPVQGQLITRQGPPQVQYAQHFQQAPQVVSQSQSQQQQPQPQLQQTQLQQQPVPPQQMQQHNIPNQIPGQHQAPIPHPQHSLGGQLEPHAVQKPNQTIIRGQAVPSWNQQWSGPNENLVMPNQQRPLNRSPSNSLLIAQLNGPGTPQILHTPQHDGARQQLPFGSQTPVRIMHTVGQRFPTPNQVLPNGELIPSGLPPVESVVESLFGHEARIQVPPNFCLVGCIFYFVEAEKNICSVSEERMESCKKVVQKYGGEMAGEYSEKCTHVICETQQNQVVQQAIKEGKRCVTIFWLNDTIIAGKMQPPHKIWHLPRAFDGDFLPCRDHIITITNFEGNERVLVKELIKATGARYTNYLDHKNTILICKKLEGPKFKKALQWDMPVVNLTWLQDILFGHHNQALSLLHKSHRYTKFESKDSCEIDYNLVKPLLAGWKVPLKVPEDLPRRIKALRDENLNKKPSSSSTQPPPVQISTSVLPPPPLPPPPLPPPSSSTQPQPSTSTAGTTVEPMVVDSAPDASKPVPTLIAKKPDNTISALASLDINDNKECPTDEPTLKKVKLEPSNEGLTNENLTGNLPPPPPLMVAPFANASPDRAAVKVMFTGFNDVTALNELKEYAKKLGLTLTNEYNKCTHLIVNRIARTTKFMCAFNHADHILTSDWIVDSFKRSHLLDESQYILSDPKGEHLYGFDLKESLARRKARSTPLFKGYVFYITRSCLPSFKILKEIAESAGAMVTKKGPSPKQLHALKKRRNDINFAVITKEEDLHTCDLFFEKETPVLNSEFILHCLLRQEIEHEPYTFKSQ